MLTRTLTAVLLAAFAVWFVLWANLAQFAVALAALFAICVWELLRITKKETWLHRILLLWVYLIPATLCILFIDSQNPAALLWLITLVACTDTGAYIVGTLYGKNKILPQISPNKTWEGYAGGVSLALFFGVVSYAYFDFHFFGESGIVVFIFCWLLSDTAQMGDFFESFLKRRSGVKDSSNLLPGHGGFLDRIDGLLFASVLMTIFMLLFN